MSRIKSVLFSLLVVCAVSAAGSASASASCGGTPLAQWVFCNDSEVELHEETVSGLGGAQVLEIKFTGVASKIECKDVHVKGTLELLGNFHFKLTYLGCKATKPPNCKLSTAEEKEILTTVLPGRITGPLPGGPPELEVEGEGAEREWVNISLENSGGTCSFAGTYRISGKQILELPDPESFKVEHEIVATKANSEFFLGNEANKVSYSGTAKIMLGLGLSWAVMPGN